MTPEVLEWVAEVVRPADVAGVDVLEVGALDVNGSVRRTIERLGPRGYHGTDRERGPGVDEVVAAEHLNACFGPDRYGLVVCTEVLEHVEPWRAAVWNMMSVTAPGGLVVLTTRSPGFGRHDWPDDWWRFDQADVRWIWAGWAIEDLRADPGYPGVFLRARKPGRWGPEATWLRLARLSVEPVPRDEPAAPA